MKKYPSQEDAQLLIDIMNDKGVYTGACSPEYRKVGEAFNAMPKGWGKLFDKTFGVNSPWDCNITGKGKCVLVWNKHKASYLKL